DSAQDTVRLGIAAPCTPNFSSFWTHQHEHTLMEGKDDKQTGFGIGERHESLTPGSPNHAADHLHQSFVSPSRPSHFANRGSARRARPGPRRPPHRSLYNIRANTARRTNAARC